MNAVSLGVIKHGRWHFAVPIDHLIEVVPCQELVHWPTDEAAICGGIEVRGNVLPVIDLQHWFDKSRISFNSVSIIQTNQGAFALTTEKVEGIVSIDLDSLSKLQLESTKIEHIIHGGFQHNDISEPVFLLDIAALITRTHVPLVNFRRQQALHSEQSLQSYMLFRCGSLAFCIDALAIHSTVLNPQLISMDVQSDYLVGAIAFQGFTIPAVDFLAWCQLNAQIHHENKQAFVIKLDDGYIAMLVEAIIDVIDIPEQTPVALSALTFPQQYKFSGVYASAVFKQRGLHTDDQVQFFITIAPDAFQDDKELSKVSRTTAQKNQEHQRLLQHGDDVILFSIGVELCVPLHQIIEILPWQKRRHWQQNENASCGLIVYRDKAITVFSLAKLCGLEPSGKVAAVHPTNASLINNESTPILNMSNNDLNPVQVIPTDQNTIVLVVAIADSYYGFAVDKLISIERSKEPVTFDENHLGTDQTAKENAIINAKFIRIERVKNPMVTCIDLHDVAQSLTEGKIKRLELVAAQDEIE